MLKLKTVMNPKTGAKYFLNDQNIQPISKTAEKTSSFGN